MSVHSKIANLLESQILQFMSDWLRPIRSGDLTKELNKNRETKIRASTVNSALQRLEKKQLLEWKRYGLVTLTELGKKEAQSLIRHHRLLETFLANELGLSKEQAHKESNNISLGLSCDIIERICKKYDHPEECPCGKIIEHYINCGCSDEGKC